MSEQSLDELAAKIESIAFIAKKLEEEHEAREEEEKERKANEEEHEKKMREAREHRDEEMKRAMEEEDDEKRDAKMKRAMDEYEKKHKAKHDEDEHKADETQKHRPKELHGEEKEEKEHVASLIRDEKANLINKILTANKITNPQNLKTIEERVKKASLSDLKNEYEIIAPFLGMANPAPTPAPQEQKLIPFMANIQQKGTEEFTASTPASEFTSISTKDLLEGAI